MPYNNVIDRDDAGPLIPEEVAQEIIQGTAETSAVMRLAKRAPDMARGVKRLPVLSALPTAYFVDGDTGIKQTSEVNWDNKYLNAEELAVILPIPEAVAEDMEYDIWDQARPLIVEALGVAFDAAVFFGTNAPATWPTSVRAAAIAAGNSVILGAGVDLYDDVLGTSGVISLVEADGFMVTGHAAAIGMRARLRGLRDANGVPIFNRSMMQDATRYELDGAPIEFPRNGAFNATTTHMISGDFQQLIYAMSKDISWKVLDQAVITGPDSHIIYNLPQQDMVALRAVMRLAWQVPNPINRLQATEASRYPFGVLRVS